MSFVHLHNRTHFTFLDGAMSPKELVDATKKAGMSSVAMTDSANLCGLVEFYNAAKDEGVHPVFGCELWIGHPEMAIPAQPKKTKKAKVVLDQLSLFGMTSSSAEEPPKPEPTGNLTPHYHLVLLIENEVGYRNLCALISKAHRQRHYAPVISPEQLAEMSEGLICLTSGEHGPFGMLDNNELDIAINQLMHAFEGSLYLELIDWGLDEDEGRNARVQQAAKIRNLPTIATNSCRYTECFNAPMYNVLRSIAVGHNPFDTDSPFVHATDQAYVKDAEEMRQLFDATSIERSMEVAERCQYVPDLGGTFLPNSTPPPECTTRQEQWNWLVDSFPPPGAFDGRPCAPPASDPDGWDIVDSYFSWYTHTGLEVRLEEEEAYFQFGTREEYFEALRMELEVIQRMKFPAYHLIVAEFINWAKDNGISVGPGRGSAAGSVAVWAMRITDVNPRQFGLMFERFLNPRRVSMPDIDVDFEQERREEVITHVQDKYGDECVGQILTIGTMKAKATLKDCARACGVHFLDADRWSKQIPEDPKAKLEASIQDSPLLSNMFEYDSKFRTVASFATQIERRPRQTGIHAAGVIITSKEISHFIPTHYVQGSDGRWKSTTGLEMNASEKMGLVKFDFLGLKTLDIIDEARASVQAKTGKSPEPIQPLFDDAKVFELLAAGDTLGLFQLESDGMQNLCRRMQTNHMDDIVAISALYRPGPLEGGMVDQYVECKHGREKPRYPHPLLKEVLEPTYGVFVFQEQVMKAAQVLAGFDLGEADLLRRAMGKKKQAEMDKQRKKFVEGCARTNDIDEDKATYIFDLIDKFAGYGFNKSHSAAYGIITYATAWMKAHYRAHLMAAAMSFEASKREKLVAYTSDCIQAGIPVLPPDVNKSGRRFRVETHPAAPDREAIRYGLEAVKGIGGSALESILEARQQRPFTSLDDIAVRTTANKTVMQALICSGALDELHPDRFETWWMLERPKIKSLLKKRDDPDQIGLLDNRTMGERDEEHQAIQEAELKPMRWTYTERLDREADALGIWLSGHPLDRFLDVESRAKTMLTTDMVNCKKNNTVTLAGVIIKIHTIKTRRGDKMTFFSLSDRAGITEVALPPAEWEKYKVHVVKGMCVRVQGVMDRDGAEGRLRITNLQTLAEMRIKMAKGIEINLTSDDLKDSERMSELFELLSRYRSDAKSGCRMQIRTEHPNGIVMKTTIFDNAVFQIDPELFETVERLTQRHDAIRMPGDGEALEDPWFGETPEPQDFPEGLDESAMP